MKVYNLYYDCSYDYDENPVITTFSTYEKAINTLFENVKGQKIKCIKTNIESDLAGYETKALVKIVTMHQLGEEELYTKYGFNTDKTLHYRNGDIYEIIESEIL